MGDYGNGGRSSGGYRGGSGFSRGGARGGFSSGRSSFGGGGRSFGGDRGDRPQMNDAVCDTCGKNCQVPFRPTQGKPVYCSDCFEKMGGRESRGNDRPRFEDRSPRSPQAQGGVDLGAINAKLDKILSILEPKNIVEVTVSKPETVKVAEVVDLPKIKKAVKKVASEKKD